MNEGRNEGRNEVPRSVKKLASELAEKLRNRGDERLAARRHEHGLRRDAAATFKRRPGWQGL